MKRYAWLMPALGFAWTAYEAMAFGSALFSGNWLIAGLNAGFTALGARWTNSTAVAWQKAKRAEQRP